MIEAGRKPATRQRQLARARLPLAVGGLSLVIGWWQPGPVVAVVDEELWLARSDAFADALLDARPSDMTAAGSAAGATMPGATTMWVGTAARFLGSGLHRAGLLDDPVGALEQSATALRLAHLVMAVVTASLIALVTLLVRMVGGSVAAGATGVLLAVEPFVASNGIVLHTDSLVALPALVSFLALWLACRSDASAVVHRGWAALSGAALGVALVTKASAAALVPGLVPVVLWWAWRHRGAARADGARALALAGLAFAAGGLGTAALLWPAIWAAPATQIEAVRASLELGVTLEPSPFTRSFFRGEVVDTPPAGFYPLAILVRSTPWLLAGAVGGLVAGLRDRGTRALTALVALAPLPYLIAIASAFKKFDRYALPVVPFLALLAGVGAALLWERAHGRLERLGRRRLAMGGALLVALLSVPVLASSPHAHAWVNPVVGDERATGLLLRGRGEGLELAGQRIAQLEGGDCGDVLVAVRYKLPPAFPCGALRFPGIGFDGGVDYVVVYLNQRQRGYESTVTEWAEAEGELVLTVDFGGVDHVWLYRVDRDSSPLDA